MGLLPAGGPLSDLTGAHPTHVRRYATDVRRNVRTRVAGD